MSALLRKSSALDRKIKRLGKDLSLVESEIRTLSKFIEKPEKAGRLARLSKTVKPEKKPETTRETQKYGNLGKKPETQPQPQKDTSKVYEERFKDYLASSFQTVQVLRRERSMQRYKAIFSVILFLLVLWWFIYNFFL
jgi:hypothetical protein